MIRYNVVRPKNITIDLLQGYQRFTETSRVKYLEQGILKEKGVKFTDSWDEEKLRSIEDFMRESQNRTIIAKENKKVVGFVVLDLGLFDGYMNMPYIHTDNRHRGRGIGKSLILLASKIAKDHGAKKLYISAHPNVDAQAFYKDMGCGLAEKINQELYELEPLDIQLERSLDYVDIMMRKINHEFKQHTRITSTLLSKLFPRVYSVMPIKDLDFINTTAKLLESNDRSLFSMGTLLFKKRASVIDEKYLDTYEDILQSHIHEWDQVDQYCYRILGPIFNSNHRLFYKLQEWSKSDNKDVRRASLVSMLLSSQKITCTYPLDKVMELVEELKEDKDIHVRKGVGWVLKCAYPTYPKEVVDFLKENKRTLDRMIYRYALEHMEKELKQEMMVR